ncbi:MAG: hypothetical protein J0J01_08815 [Reyranella sp.]|uniref:hypothetical protein n=1 Tax=Reyranella sp. TaxID=1929291 RepID=UPI001AC59D1D|nr:hypothetical protein [Reyranella sp.]MBN9086994.1 hypothetical protein [Reyranella sp.]
MPTVHTVADYNPDFAVALGRFAEACCILERSLESALFRILPITDHIGRVLLSGNQMRRNAEILRALAILPDVPLSDSQRTLIETLTQRINAVNADRSRLLHNPVIDGDNDVLAIVQHKQDGTGSSMMPITTHEIVGFAAEAKAISWELITHLPRLEYDLSKWVPAAPSYPTKPYPKRQSPRQKRETRK